MSGKCKGKKESKKKGIKTSTGKKKFKKTIIPFNNNIKGKIMYQDRLKQEVFYNKNGL
jgi:hypothetical protein